MVKRAMSTLCCSIRLLQNVEKCLNNSHNILLNEKALNGYRPNALIRKCLQMSSHLSS